MGMTDFLYSFFGGIADMMQSLIDSEWIWWVVGAIIAIIVIILGIYMYVTPASTTPLGVVTNWSG